MRKFLAWLAITGIVAAVGLTLFTWWDLDLRWRPHTITKHQDEIAKALDQAGWVSPHLTGPKLYMISYRSCSDCIRFEEQEFPKLQAVGVDTRVILIARPDRNGLSHSTAAERASVAELWINRSWKLYQQWSAVTPEAWTAPGIAPADGDAARTAVVEAGRAMLTDLPPMLSDNGIKFAYPTLIWWTKDGKMRACACEKPQTYHNVEKELGA
ncbi:MAG: hypothetical protein ACHP7N_19560 [Caulobacterales bacterium]